MSRAVVVGSSVAGVRAVQALRRNGFDGTITLLGEEKDLPYDKPPLSKAVLAGADPSTAQLLSAEQAAELGVELRLGVAAARLDISDRLVELADGTSVGYDDVVIATGARARPSPWHTAGGVHVLRTMGDCERLRADLAEGGAVVVVGGGFIGAEVASTARASGLDVTIVDPVAVPMARAVGDTVGRRMVDLHHRNGTLTRFGIGVEGIVGERGRLTVELTDGSALHCATVVVGIGAIPNDEWLADSGLALDDGIGCDEYGRTGPPGVYALGDVARWHHPRRGRPTRAEHWTNAVDQANIIATSITTPDQLRPHDPVEYVWSDQYDWKMQIVGAPHLASREETVTAEADVDRFATLYADDGDTLLGGAIVNWPKASIALRRALGADAGFTETLEKVQSLLG
jgi:phthalate 3,4-dioxygenase ferredoxin reductase subunit